MEILTAELLLHEDDPGGALLQLERVPSSFRDALGGVRERGHETWARALIANGRVPAALDILNPLVTEQRESGRNGRLIASLVLAAAARERRGDRAGSIGALAEAVTIAAGHDVRRPFMDRVLPVGHLLPSVRHRAPAFVDDILARMGVRSATSAQASHTVVGSTALGAAEVGVEPLSVRELEVLRLVAAGLTNEEIGRELFVTSGTAKWHVHNVLAKLGSRNRASLIAKARSIGLV
jgi:LuxR family maltose regulon positive regulatory protein